ncbi:MAG: hypothetical protein JOZ54_10690 [Acidobacteria bacterium]|nr:hypothetical protein [Acidobacteriota bacterium]
MPIVLPYPLNAQELRVLQEFRRLQTETLPTATIKAIKHPVGGGEAPAVALAGKGWLTPTEMGDGFTLTQKAKDLLAIDPKPEVESAAGDDEEVVIE